MKELLEAGVHFGHQTKRWNPKMKEYIFGERNGIYIIDLQKTLKLFKDRFILNCARLYRTSSGPVAAASIGTMVSHTAKVPSRLLTLEPQFANPSQH